MEDNLNFKNYKLSFRLEAQSPLVHFQGSQIGATLRASEVKPKLDRFIFQKLLEAERVGKNNDTNEQDIIKIKEKYASLFLDKKHDAFNYKLSVYVDKAPWHCDIDPRNEKRYQIFYGNQNRREDRFERVICDPIISILCFNVDLQQLLLKYIEEFFIVTNFGTMQSKGFGSFILSGIQYTDALIAKYLKSVYRTQNCYKMEIFNPEEFSKGNGSYEVRDDSYETISMHISYFYKIMKSGWNQNKEYCRSYICQYMHEKYKMPNEKAWMKRERIAPSRNDHSIIDENSRFSGRDENDYRYIRAFLGTGGSLRYLNTEDFYTLKYDKKKDEYVKSPVTITITPNDSKDKPVLIERVSSPIFFKIIKGSVYIVGASVPDDIYNKEFLFSNNAWGINHQKFGIRSTPKKTELTFDMNDFLSNYVDFYNNKIPEKIKQIKAKHVSTIKC